MTKAELDYREILKQEFAKRAELNSRYSLRAFARDIDFTPARLSHVLNGTYGLSIEAGRELATKLGMNAKQKELFCNLIEAKHGRSNQSKLKAKSKLKKSSYDYSDIEMDSFKVISDWYHFPIVELTLTENFINSAKWISGQLGISEIEAKHAVDRLIKVGLLVNENGSLSPSSRFYVNQKEIPDASVKKYHRQLLEKAILALETQSTAIRDFGALTIALDEADIPYVKEKLKECRILIDKEISKNKNKKFVYTISTQFFCMQTQKPKINLIN